MKLTRRYFLTAVGASALATGCSWETDLENWGPIGLVAFNSILSLLGVTGSTVLIDGIKAALQDIPAIVKAYQNDPNPTTLGKVDDTLNQILTDFQQFLAQENVINPVVALVAGLAQIILAAVAGFIEDAQTPTLTKSRKAIGNHFFRMGGQQFHYTPKLYGSKRSFKSDWNKEAVRIGRPTIKMHITIGDDLQATFAHL